MITLSVFLRTLALAILLFTAWVALLDLDKPLMGRGFVVFRCLLVILAALSLTIAYNI